MKQYVNTLITTTTATTTPVSSLKQHKQPLFQMSNVNLEFSPVVKLENIPVLSKRATLKRQPQSLTFIADLASTSTPTRVSQQPIASTPKMKASKYAVDSLVLGSIVFWKQMVFIQFTSCLHSLLLHQYRYYRLKLGYMDQLFSRF